MFKCDNNLYMYNLGSFMKMEKIILLVGNTHTCIYMVYISSTFLLVYFKLFVDLSFNNCFDRYRNNITSFKPYFKLSEKFNTLYY